MNLASDIGVKVNIIHNQISNANIFPIIGREYFNYFAMNNNNNNNDNNND